MTGQNKTSNFSDSSAIRTEILDTFPYGGTRQTIEYSTREFSAVCPFSGLPDLGSVTIQYIPSQKCIELKSLKLYFFSFRNVGIYQEHATDRIFSDLWNLVRPTWMQIETVYATRGGIDAKCTIERGERNA